jgi:hypothetical protein
MSLLGFLEEKLGPITAWPTQVLRLLFVDAGTSLTMTAVAAFFYGNSIPLNAALSFYRICNDNLHDTVDMAFEDCYETWDATGTWPVMYYDMSLKKHKFINGLVLRVSETYLGFGNEDVFLTDDVQRKLNRADNTSYSSHTSYASQ